MMFSLQKVTLNRGLWQDRILPFLLPLIYLILIYQFHSYMRPDQLFLIFALTAIAILGGKGGKQFIIDWAPFTIFIILYDGLRGIADNTFGYINVKGPYIMEQYLYGWATDGKIVPFLLQWWRQSLNSNLLTQILNIMSALLYSIHFLAPFIFGWLLWHTYRDRKTFYAFAYSLTILNILALITFFLYPAAPPWYVWKYHFAEPFIETINYSNAANLINFDKLINFPLFSSVYHAFNINAFAAIPSLHGAYPLMITCFAFKKWKNWYIRSIFILYVTGTWFAACYLNHHYLIDLLLGALYVFVSIIVYKKIMGPYVIEPIFFKRVKKNEIIYKKRNPIVSTIFFLFSGIALIILLIAHANGYL